MKNQNDEEPASPVDAATLAAMRAAAPALKNGTYTVSHPTKPHFTIKLYTATGGNLAGERIFALLTGPDNQRDYSGVAFWKDKQRVANVWRRFRGQESEGRIMAPPAKEPAPRSGDHPGKQHEPVDLRADAADSEVSGWTWDQRGWSIVEQKLSVLLCLALRGERGYWYAEGFRLHVEGRCVKCNRKLTTPESIETGVGPICAGRS